jgi:hypothetical protein
VIETKTRREVEIGRMEPDELSAVVNVLASALRDNPSFAHMFGPKPRRRLRSNRILCRVIVLDIMEPPVVARL